MRIRIVTEGASRAADAPSVTSPMAPRHLPRFTGEEKKERAQVHLTAPEPAEARRRPSGPAGR